MAQNPSGGRGLALMVIILVAVGTLVAVALSRPGLIRFWPFSMGDFVQLVTPLFLVSLFIERALEVFVTSWRGEDTDKIELAIATTQDQMSKAKGQALADAEENLMARQLDLARYKSGTRRKAFVGGVLVGLIISALGVRALQLFVDPAAFATLTTAQQRLFTVADVLLTGGAIGGGADGMHKLVSVFTNFMDSTASLAKARGGKGG